jgi:hypothetical protein
MLRCTIETAMAASSFRIEMLRHSSFEIPAAALPCKKGPDHSLIVINPPSQS